MLSLPSIAEFSCQLNQQLIGGKVFFLLTFLLTIAVKIEGGKQENSLEIGTVHTTALIVKSFSMDKKNPLGVSGVYRKNLVQPSGFEPPTSCMSSKRSNQLSYGCVVERDYIERVLTGQLGMN